MIPSNITKEHILQAMTVIDRDGMPPERQSTKYLVEHENKRYAPKYVVSVANRFANGKMLAHTEFSGGVETNEFLESRGFRIVELGAASAATTSTHPYGTGTTRVNVRSNGMEPTSQASGHEVQAKSKTIHIAEGATGYSYDNLFGPYLRGARRVHVIDPFVRMEYQVRNFVAFADILDGSGHSVELALTTSSDNLDQEQVMRQKFAEIAQILRQHGILFTFEFSSTIHDRSLKTDTGWSIYPGRGLDIFQRPESHYELGMVDQTKRKCKETEIVFVKE